MKCKHCFAIHNKTDMSEFILNKGVNYICDKINSTNEKEYFVNFLGGEAGLYNQDLIKESIQDIKYKTLGKVVKFIYQSNLTYTLTNKHIELFKMVDFINTSYDYDIRFINNEQEKWEQNIYLLQNNGCEIGLTMVLTKTFIEHFLPKTLIDFVKKLNIKIIEFNCLFNTLNGDELKQIRAKNIDVNEWLYQLYRYVKKNEIDIDIKTFKCIEDSFIHNHYNDHCRTCCSENITIQPNGNVITCMLDTNLPIYNLCEDRELNSIESVCKMESNLHKKCYDCEYLKWCKGNCHHYIHDETGCPTPTKIYDYLIVMDEMKASI
jgi:radical SAM protein with 4Fe4S-binding SPASM domain